MAKRRNKNKAKRYLAGLDRKLKINGEIVEKMLKKEGLLSQSDPDGESTDWQGIDLGGKVQVTENGILTDSRTENELNSMNIGESRTDEQSKPKMGKQNTNKPRKLCKSKSDSDLSDEVLIFPTEVNGETCIDITCGNNDAQLYLSRLCLGSKGSCIFFSNSWYTPNEFQSVSGRETAKDWKRSIRHKGRSLKLLISKGLINVQGVTPREARRGDSEGVVSPHDNTAAYKPLSDEKDNARKVSPVHQAIIQDTKPVENKPKRGRKPKKLRQKNMLRDKSTCTDLNTVHVKEAEPETSVPPAGTTEDFQIRKDDVATESHTDSRTDEERRLDEFVKTLKLTKATAPRAAPELPVVQCLNEEVQRQHEVNETVTDPEMPVLQKEEDIRPTSSNNDGNDRTKSEINIDTTFHVTVTPPPTPPGVKPEVIKETDDVVLTETFKSRLSSPSNGLKLTINREKIKPVEPDVPEAEIYKSKSNPTIENEDISKQNVPKSSLQTMLLQDALKSAKKYKEQLKQNPKTMPVKPIIQVPKISPQETSPEPRRQAHVSTKVIDYKLQKDLKQPNSTYTIPGAFSGPDVSRRPHIPTGTENGAASNILSTYDFGSLAGMSFQDFLGVLSSIYGPLPFIVNTKESAFAALQEMHRRHDMLRFVTHGQVDPSSPSFLYSMITQQILLTMTQQLYSSCNMPDLSPSRESEKIDCSSPPQRDNAQMRKETVTATTVHPYIPKQDIPVKKRKYPEDDAPTDCALDLSVKKPKSNQSAPSNSMPKHESVDAPLDFSMKKVSYSDKCLNKNVSQNVNPSSWSRKPDSITHLSSHTASAQRSRSLYCRCIGAVTDDVTKWSVDQVCAFLRSLDGCAQYAKTFHEQGISGRLLPYLTTQHLTRTLGMKVGPALTFLQAIDQKLKDRRPSVCLECNLPLLPPLPATATV